MKVRVVALAIFAINGVMATTARAEKWPISGHIEKIFKQGAAFGYSDWLGVDITASEIKSVEDFDFVRVNWNKSVPCGQEVRPKGYLHSDPVILSREKTLWIGVPIKFSIESTHVGLRKMEVLNSPLLKISLIGLHSQEMTYYPLQKPRVYTLNDLYKRTTSYSVDRTVALNFNFNNIIYTKPVKVPAGTNYRVRIDWYGDGFCDEQSLDFSIGDQVRIFKPVENL